MRVGSRGPHVGIVPYNDTVVSIWTSNILRDDRNRVDTRRSSTYYVVELHNNHCYVAARANKRDEFNDLIRAAATGCYFRREMTSLDIINEHSYLLSRT